MKRIIRLTENDLSRIVRRVINERQYLMEGVPNTTLESMGPINIESRSVCLGTDYIKVSFQVKNTGKHVAYLVSTKAGGHPTIIPDFVNNNNERPDIYGTMNFNVLYNGKPSWSSPDGQAQRMIPAKSVVTINTIIRVELGNIYDHDKYKTTNPDLYRRRKIQNEMRLNATQNVRSGKIIVPYNGGELEIPVTFGGFKLDSKRTCDKEIILPKGY